MHRATDELVRVEFATQRSQLAAFALAKDGLRDADGATEAGDDAADGSYFYLRGGVSDEVNVSVADAAFDGHPLAIDGNLSALPLERLHVLFLEEAREALCGVG